MVWDTRVQTRGAVAIPSPNPVVDEQIMRLAVERHMNADPSFTVGGMIAAKQGRRLYVILVPKRLAFITKFFNKGVSSPVTPAVAQI